jgi:sigma-B regulation protein RsbU (phosphoserine phosphatase)
MEAPWTLVIVAPGNKILAPILRFGWYFLLFGSMFVVIVLVLIRWGTGQTVTSIKTISWAAEKVAGGDYKQHLPVNTADEVGELTRSFNAMLSQLQERMRLKRAMDLAMEVQQNLLPQQALNVNGVDIYGKSLYCDETGGDYYDFIYFPEMGQNRIGIAVGDVVGHGVAAALIMSSVRAFLRSAVLEKTALSRVADHVNRLLCNDTTGTGNFMTLFFLVLDTECRELRWVRAGHDPAMVYDSETESFQYLKGEGLALGVDANWRYEEYRFTEIAGSTVILIGTDGLWETENERGENFGRDRLRAVLKQNSQRSSQKIVETILAAINSFRGDARQADDITLVVVRNLACSR